MRIGIDISRTIEEATGVGYYAKNLVHALARVDSKNDYLLYGMFYDCYPKEWKKASIPNSPNFKLHQKHSLSWLARKRWENGGRYKEKLLGGIDLLHSTAFTMPPVSGPKIVVTIHDLSCFIYPQYHTEANYQFVNRNVHQAARKASFIISVSESTKKEIFRFLHVPEERIGVVYEAAGGFFYNRYPDDFLIRIRNKYKINKKYFLTVGSLEPRKNLASALIAFKALLDIRKIDYQFVIAGGKGWENESFYRLLKKLGIDDYLVFTGYVPEEDLPALYQGAEVFVYPSFYEGFGLPVLEAMASGTPVITSNTSSLPEVAGDAALLVNPMEVFEIYEAMEALITNPSLREELQGKGLEQSKKFSWEKTARQTLEIYERYLPMEERINPKHLIKTLSVEHFCKKADEYYQKLQNPLIQMSKPFAFVLEAPDLLWKMGLLLSGLKLGKSMVVMDFGAGTCWLSRFLNQLQCSTISVDVSVTALNIGRTLFDQFPIMGKFLEPPKFIPFDGHTIAIEDSSIDRIICFDTFHHIPNQKEILREFFRVLKSGGIAGFCEPGPHHSQSPQSQYEMRNYSVLENDIVLNEIKRDAEEVGFNDFYTKLTNHPDLELSYQEYAQIISEKTLPRIVQNHLIASMENTSIFFLIKGIYRPDSRGHLGLKHTIEIPKTDFRIRFTEPLTLEVTISNVGNAIWLHKNIHDIGVVKLGTHLYDSELKLIDLDFHRSYFDEDILPGQKITKNISLPPMKRGTYYLAIDLVSEHVCWFENVSSEPKFIKIIVE